MKEDSRTGIWDRLSRTRSRLAEAAGNLFLGERSIDQDALDDLEAALLGTDVGVDATQRIVDAMLAIPGLVLALIFAAVFTPGVTTGIFAIILIIIPFNARVIRSAVLAVKENVYVEAARVIGAGPSRIMLRHILPNVVAPILIMISTVLGAAILIEAGLAFLGMGAQDPEPSWGLMLSGRGRQFMELAPWLAIFPAFAIMVTVLAFNLLGDVIRDVLDPRLRGT